MDTHKAGVKFPKQAHLVRLEKINSSHFIIAIYAQMWNHLGRSRVLVNRPQKIDSYE